MVGYIDKDKLIDYLLDFRADHWNSCESELDIEVDTVLTVLINQVKEL